MISNVDFMRALEDEYRQVTGVKNRSEFKIFYGQVFPSPILTLGLNPGGNPQDTSEDGTRQKDGSLASSSGSYFEQMENDILDCDWRENSGLRNLLLPLVNQDLNRFRREVVKTNIAFRRSRVIGDIDLAEAVVEAAPFIDKIIARVVPRLIVLTGPNIERFLKLYALDSRPLTESIKAPRINHVVFAARAARLRSIDGETIVVQVAHASQFGWTYDRYDIPTRIAALLDNVLESGSSAESGSQSNSASIPAASSVEKLGYRVQEIREAPMMRISNPRLAELDSAWRDLGIGSQFRQVHHFASPKFSGKGDSLDRFIAWCDVREIKAENAQTILRALDTARRVKNGQAFDEALRQAWAAHPIVTR